MTVTSNIHVGLSAWSNHTFVLAERCSTGGNAYQCITAGTSTSAPTGTTADVDNGGAAHFKWLSAIDYTSVTAWVAGWPLTLVDNLVGQLWNNGTITTTAGAAYMTVTGFTMGAFTATLTAAPGEGIRDSLATGAALQFDTTKGVSFTLPSSAGSGGYFNIGNVGFIFDGIQFLDPLSTSASSFISASSLVTVRNCIFDGFGQASGHTLMAMGGGIALSNSLVIDRQATGNGGITISLGGGTATVVNSTIHSTNANTGGGAVLQSGGTSVIIKNTACTGYATTAFVAGSGTMTADHCLVSTAALHASVTDGGNNLLSKTAANQYVSDTADFRLKPGADCIVSGVTDLTDIPTGDDIAREPRGTNWSIGADQFQNPIPAFSPHRTIQIWDH